MTRVASSRFALLAMAVVSFVSLSVAAFCLASLQLGIDSCSWRAKSAFKSGEAFITSFTRNVSNSKVATYDCEDGGPAFLTFEVSDPPVTFRDMLLMKASCKRVLDSSEPDVQVVLCGVEGNIFVLYIAPKGVGASQTELYVSFN